MYEYVLNYASANTKWPLANWTSEDNIVELNFLVNLFNEELKALTLTVLNFWNLLVTVA